jgi:hypothetical protein
VGPERKRKKITSSFDKVIFGVSQNELESYDVCSLQTLGTLLDGEFHFLAFFEVLETFTLYGREVDEDIRAAFTFDEAETLCSIEPFNRTDYTIRHFLPPKQNKKIR